MLQDIVIKQKQEYERRLREPYIRRQTRLKGINTDMINVVIGPRRAGKSFFCIRTLSDLQNVTYLNFDDESLIEVRDFNDIMIAIKSVYGQSRTLLLDEVQNVTNWELIVNRLQREDYHLILTGSNSKLLSSELSTHLTGRHLQTCLLPFSFSEVVKLSMNEKSSMDRQSLLMQYINQGGFPEPWVKQFDFRDYLGSLFDSILYKDIVKRHKIRFPLLLENISKYLISSITGEYTARSLTKAVGAKSDHTVMKYFYHLEEAFVFFQIPRFSFKVKQQIKTASKVYCYDTGFHMARAFSFSPDTGKLFENVVAIELRRKELEGNIHLSFWKNDLKEEVDFVVQQGIKVTQLIQVCADIGSAEVNKREARALLKASKELKCDRLTIITIDIEKTEKHSWFGLKANIEYIPFEKWISIGIHNT